MKKVIDFIPSDELTEKIIDPPTPTKLSLPEWYKKLHFKNNKNNLWRNPDGSSNLTIKGCMPVFDTLTSGYLITLPCDVYLNNNPEMVRIISPAYLYPEGKSLPFKSKIIIRDKQRLGGHNKFRVKIEFNLMIYNLKDRVKKIFK